MSAPFRVLIVGSGICGPVVAYWLNRASTTAQPIHVTIIDKAPEVVKLGQGIDIEGPAREVVTRMGLFDIIKSRTTGEAGFRPMNTKNEIIGTFEQGGATREIEIMRGNLCEILTDAVKGKPNVDFRYNRYVTEIAQTTDVVRVTVMTNEGQSYEEEYDVVIASDGLRSKTRALMLDTTDTKDCIDSKPLFVSYFSIPAQSQDGPYSRAWNSVGGRSLFIRPVTKDYSSVYLSAIGEHPKLRQALADRDQQVQRQAWAETFADVTYGEFPRILNDIQTSDNFYTDQIAQVKLPTWHKGRCAVVGDTAYCPAPITGQGTALAILGGYMLAGELATNLSEPTRGFDKYEQSFRPYVKRAQQIPLGGYAPYVVNPQTWWGIWLLQTLVWLVAASRVWKLFPSTTESYTLPDYNFG